MTARTEGQRTRTILVCAAALLVACAFFVLGSRPPASRAKTTGSSSDETQSLWPATGGTRSAVPGPSGHSRVDTDATARVLVTSESGSPVEDALVSLSPMGDPASATTAVTNAAGVADFVVAAEGVYYAVTSHPGYVERADYGALPGDLPVTLRQGARLTVVLEDFPSVAWLNSRILVEHEATGRQRTVEVRGRREDAGRWPPGTVHVALVGDPDIPLADVAMPDSGEVTLPLSASRRTVGVVVRDSSESGALVSGWRAGIARLPTGVDATWEPLAPADAGGGAYSLEVPAGPALLRIEQDGYAPAILRLDDGSGEGDPVTVVIRRGCALEVSLDPAYAPVAMQVAYVAGAHDADAMFVRSHVPLARDHAGAVAIGSGNSYPPVAVLAHAQVSPGTAARVYPLPPSCVVAVSLADGQTQHVRLGDAGTTTAVAFLRPAAALAADIQIWAPGQRPGAGAQVTLRKTVAGQRPQTVGVCYAGPDGRLLLTGLRADEAYDVAVVHGGLFGRTALQRDVLAGNRPVFAVVLGREESSVVAARVIDEAGRPRHGLVVSFCVADGPSLYEVTGADGVAMARVPKGERVYIYVRAPDDPHPVGGRWTGSEDAMTIVVPRTRASLAAGVRKVGRAGAVKLTLWRGRTRIDGVDVFVDGFGVATFRTRPGPGEYRVVALTEGGEARQDVTVAGEDARAELTVP